MRRVEFKTISVNGIVANRQALGWLIVEIPVLNIWEGTTHATPIVMQKSTRRSISNEDALQ